MRKQGSSRKGARRRQAVAAVPRSEELGLADAAPAADIVKLDVSIHGFVKEIARIEAPITREETPLPGHQRCDETQWGQEIPRRMKRSTWVQFSVVIFITIASIALFNRFASSGESSLSQALPVIQVLSDDIDPSSPVYAFEKNPAHAQSACVELFRRYCAAQHVTEVLPLIRPLAGSEDRITRHWRPWPSPPLLQDASLFHSESHQTDDRGYLIIRGSNANGKPFLAFFVAEKDNFLLDWEATTQFSENRLSAIALEPADQAQLMRVILTPNPYYLIDTPESEYESYKITSADEETIAWGYIRRDSPDHKKLRELCGGEFDPRSPVPSVRATVRLKTIDSPSQYPRFFITEMLHKDWVMP